MTLQSLQTSGDNCGKTEAQSHSCPEGRRQIGTAPLQKKEPPSPTVGPLAEFPDDCMQSQEMTRADTTGNRGMALHQGSSGPKKENRENDDI